MKYEYENPELIKKFKDALKIDNRAYNFDSAGFYTLFLAVDDLISKIIANRKICETWQKIIKPERLMNLNKNLEFFETILAEQTDFKTFSTNQLKVIRLELEQDDCDPRAIIKHNKLLRWIDLHNKCIFRCQKKINQVKNEITHLKHNNTPYMIDTKGKSKPLSTEFSSLFNQINEKLMKNDLKPLSQSKLNHLLLESREFL